MVNQDTGRKRNAVSNILISAASSRMKLRTIIIEKSILDRSINLYAVCVCLCVFAHYHCQHVTTIAAGLQEQEKRKERKQTIAESSEQQRKNNFSILNTKDELLAKSEWEKKGKKNK